MDFPIVRVYQVFHADIVDVPSHPHCSTVVVQHFGFHIHGRMEQWNIIRVALHRQYFSGIVHVLILHLHYQVLVSTSGIKHDIAGCGFL